MNLYLTCLLCNGLYNLICLSWIYLIGTNEESLPDRLTPQWFVQSPLYWSGLSYLISTNEESLPDMLTLLWFVQSPLPQLDLSDQYQLRISTWQVDSAMVCSISSASAGSIWLVPMRNRYLTGWLSNGLYNLLCLSWIYLISTNEESLPDMLTQQWFVQFPLPQLDLSDQYHWGISTWHVDSAMVCTISSASAGSIWSISLRNLYLTCWLSNGLHNLLCLSWIYLINIIAESLPDMLTQLWFVQSPLPQLDLSDQYHWGISTWHVDSAIICTISSASAGSIWSISLRNLYLTCWLSNGLYNLLCLSWIYLINIIEESLPDMLTQQCLVQSPLPQLDLSNQSQLGISSWQVDSSMVCTISSATADSI
jgi:hypothetical protein